MNVTFRQDAREFSSPDVRVAWYRYLTAIRACPAEVYEKTEDAAWQRLVEELASIDHADPGVAPWPPEGSP